jgi:hypothetical protein
MNYCCSHAFLDYNLEDEEPDFIILDSCGERIKVDTEGYLLDEDGSRCSEDSLWKLADLDENQFEDYTTRELWEAKADWVKLILEEQFPKDINLKLSFDTE